MDKRFSCVSKKNVNMLGRQKPWHAVLILGLCSGLVTGCVSTGKYEAEKARALNFQRLLAQEEKRTGELNLQVQETQQKVASLESQNQDLTNEVQSLQDQLSRAQEERLTVSERKVSSTTGEPEDLTLSDPSFEEFGLSDMGFGSTDQEPELSLSDEPESTLSDESDFTLSDESVFTLSAKPEPTFSSGDPIYYTVVKGDTLFRISREYGVSVSDLKLWNNLDSNLISVGQRLIVSNP